jgi:hypothetical protein
MLLRGPVDDFLDGLLPHYDKHVRASGAYDKHAKYPLPSLANGILPMFLNQWATGPGQQTRKIYPWLKPAFKLASRLLSEDYPLMWFCHLTFGERRRGTSGIYIVPTAFSTSPEAIARVRKNIRNVGALTTFMFAPGHRESGSWGCTTRFKNHQKFYGEFPSRHWPPINQTARQGFGQPCVVISAKFQDFFLNGHRSATQDEAYRATFLFATTLVHEFVHAYEFWLSNLDDEPLWSKDEKEAELGWSWEANVMGYGLQTLNGRRHPSGSVFPYMYQMKIMAYNSSDERVHAYSQLGGSNRNDAPFTKADARGRIAAPPVLDASEIRYSEHFLDNGTTTRRFVAAMQVIPMKWVTAWFDENEWRYRAQYWQQQRKYVRPTLGNPFVILYERNGNRTSTLRPLDPTYSVDKDILERRGRGDYSR